MAILVGMVAEIPAKIIKTMAMPVEVMVALLVPMVIMTIIIPMVIMKISIPMVTTSTVLPAVIPMVIMKMAKPVQIMLEIIITPTLVYPAYIKPPLLFFPRTLTL